jgi:hypothetical protein
MSTIDRNELKDTYNKEINIFWEIDYNNYKNKIKKYILNHFRIIFEMFDEEFNDNLIKMHILYKKNLLEKNHVRFINTLIDFSNYLYNLELVDQEEYFLTILKIFNILLLYNKINISNLEIEKTEQFELNKVELIGTKYIKLIDLNFLYKRIYDCINIISEENNIVKIFMLFINKKNVHTKKNIILVSEKLSLDLFMYWTSNELYKLIMQHIKISKNRLFFSIKKYKEEFLKSYEFKINILKKIYTEEINNKYMLKYKLELNNNSIKELINDTNAINLKFNQIDKL